MITPEEENFILHHAYIPEHIVGLMTIVSGGDPFLFRNYFFCQRHHWIVLVGYPLQQDFDEQEFKYVLHEISKKFRPRNVSLIVSQLPQATAVSCAEKEFDHYYTLETAKTDIKPGLKRIVHTAEQRLSVEVSRSMGKAHAELSDEFAQRIDPPLRVRNLLFKMPEYVDHSNNAIVLNAWDQNKKLAAFYIVDMAAVDFSAYVIGCHSKNNYTPGASDLLFREMIRLSLEKDKRYIHLGLGVSEGIRRFKKKWGGKPARKYEMCELVLRKPSLLETFTALLKKGYPGFV
jgi:hypothetical protein